MQTLQKRLDLIMTSEGYFIIKDSFKNLLDADIFYNSFFSYLKIFTEMFLKKKSLARNSFKAICEYKVGFDDCRKRPSISLFLPKERNYTEVIAFYMEYLTDLQIFLGSETSTNYIITALILKKFRETSFLFP
jgi:hypothetical protein